MGQIRALKSGTWWATFDAITNHLLANPKVQLIYSDPIANSNFRRLVGTATDAMLTAITDAAIDYTQKHGDSLQQG